MNRTLRSLGFFRQKAIWASICALIALALIAPINLLSQTNTADILGTVTDPSGGVIPGSKVTLVNQDTKQTRTVQTDGSGSFVFSPLQPGAYTLTVTMDGFQTLSAKDIVVAAGDRRRFDSPLKVGGSNEIIDVSAASGPALQTDSSVVASTVTERAVQDLPLAGRNFIALAQLQPGATEGSPNSFNSGTRPDDRRQGSSVAINGQPDVINNQLLDGLDNNEKLIGTIGARPSVEAIAEVRVLTNTFTADSGRAAGAVINVITKSGTNTFHGSAFEYYRNDKLNAFPWGSTLVTGTTITGVSPKPKLHLNQFGGSFGGPIFKDKTFFFGDIEFFRQVKGIAPQTVNVPSVAAKTGFYGIPASERDSAALFYINLYPNPNGGCSNTATTPISNGAGNGQGGTYSSVAVGANSPNANDICTFTGSRVGTQNSRLFDVRVDHHFNSNNSLFGRYSDNDVTTNFPTTPFPDVTTSQGVINPNSGFAGIAPQKARNMAVTYTHTFTERLLMQVSAQYSYLNNASYPLNYDKTVNNNIGQANVNSNPLAFGLAPAIVSSLGTTLGNAGNFIPLQYKDNNYLLSGYVLYNKGKQSIKVGGTGIRRTGLLLQNNVGAGSWTFPTLPDFIRGYFNANTVNINLRPPTIQTWEPSFFLQDDYRVSNNLTLNLGVRYDIYTPNTEKHNYLSNWDDGAKLMRIAGVNSTRSGGVRTDYSNVSPRIGFAYTVRTGTVVRGGFGIAFFPTNIASGFAMKGPPYVAAYGSCTSALSDTNSSGCLSTNGRFRQGLPVPTAVDPVNPRGSLGSSIDPGFRSGYLEQYNLAIQQQFGNNTVTITYVGSQGRRLPIGANRNNVLPVNGCTLLNGPSTLTSTSSVQPTATCATTPNPNPATPNVITPRNRPYVGITSPTNLSAFANSAVATTVSQAMSNFNSLQLQFERRFSHGLGINSNYVWAHGLDNRPDPSGNTAGGTGQNAATRAQDDYGNGDIDIRNRISVLINYAPQFAKGFTGWKKMLFDGYQFNVINVWSTGSPNNVINGNSGTACGANLWCVSPNGGADRAQITGDYHVSNQGPGTSQFFNPTVFRAQTVGTKSNQARNQIYGPHFRHWDGSVFRDISLPEHMNLQLRAEFFNIGNQTNFYLTTANMTVGNTNNLGRLTQTTPQYTPRQLQFAAKLTF